LPFSQLKNIRCWRLAACLAACLLVFGCAAHKAAPPAPITYPPTPEAALRDLRRLPLGPYDRLQIITVTAEVGKQLASAIKSARESAAQKGANALVLLEDKQFRQKIGKRTMKIRRITYLAIHRQ
jgi:hypothetical protein